MSSRYQRNNVSGVTRSAISLRFSRHNAFAFAARRRRWSSVKRRRRAPSCSPSTRFSSFRYSITSCWDRSTQPAKVNARNCHRWGCIGRILAVRDTGATLASRKSHSAPLCFASIEFWHTTIGIGARLQNRPAALHQQFFAGQAEKQLGYRALPQCFRDSSILPCRTPVLEPINSSLQRVGSAFPNFLSFTDDLLCLSDFRKTNLALYTCLFHARLPETHGPLDLTTTLPPCVAPLAAAFISTTKTVLGDFAEGRVSRIPSR